MVVSATVQPMLIAHYAILKIDLESQPALGQQLERPVNGCIPDARVFLLHQPMQILGAEVFARIEKHLKNAVSLAALLQSFFTQIPTQDALGNTQ